MLRKPAREDFSFILFASLVRRSSVLFGKIILLLIKKLHYFICG
ncbi:hypothetical protein B4090_2030 [Bacillus licheniformis]|nr:hypothetical protein MUY_001961 [Bacillus licheniformis WX-02]KYC75344.1 hypothetical protein B4090_2030 [Bacillus licheniformis]TWM62994.1 hypothetical protein CHCC14813_3045 [Bacillus licheniformis]TWN04952.1 hypothetical protein CHCC14596_2608 [Bacillus licheniformis]TWN05443.1 hypothetical protein CHCC14566_3721 [Bacillus licheniformis]